MMNYGMNSITITLSKRHHREVKQNYIKSRFSDLDNSIMIDFMDSYCSSEVQKRNQSKLDHDNSSLF